MNLNYLLIIFSILSAVNFTVNQTPAARHSNQFLACIKEQTPPATLVIMKAAIVAKLENSAENVKCFLNCWYAGKKFIVDNDLKTDVIIKNFKDLHPTADHNGLQKAIDICKSKLSAPVTCQNVYDFHKCVISPATVTAAQG